MLYLELNVHKKTLNLHSADLEFFRLDIREDHSVHIRFVSTGTLNLSPHS